MRILLIHNFYQQLGGEDLVVNSELKALSARAEVRLYSRHNDEIKSFGSAAKALVPLRAIASPSTKRDLPAVIRDFQPDVAYVHNLFPLITPAAYDVLRDADVPVLQAIHNFRMFCARADFLLNGKVCERCLSGSAWNGVIRKCYRDSYALTAAYAAAGWKARKSIGATTHFLVQSEFVRQKYIAGGVPASTIFLRPNSVDTRAIRPANTAGEYALFLGRLSPEKGLLTLLKAFARIPSLPLVIAGSGPLEAELRRYAAQNNLGNVRFAGFQSGAAKWDLIANAKCLVFPSEWYESFPLSLLEAFAMGKPVVGSSIGSIPYLIEDGKNGLLFKLKSPLDLASRVRELFENPELCARLGRAARQMAEQRYDSGANLEALLSVFRTVVAGCERDVPVSLAEATP